MENTLKFLAYEGMVKVTCINTTDIVKKAKNIHNLSKTATAAFGRLLTMAAIIGADLKDEEDNVTFQIKGNGPIGSMTCVSKMGAKVKGYVQNGSVEVQPKENGKLDVSGIVGTEGKMYIIRDIGLKEPYIGIGDIISGEIAEDFANYYAVSEQIPTVVALGVSFESNGEIKNSGGYFIQLMPDATEKVISKLENIQKELPTVTQLLEKDTDLSNMARSITGDEDLLTMVGNINNEYKCDCSKERIERGLISLGKVEFKKIVEERKNIETKCQFCDKEYSFTVDELNELYASIAQ